MKELDIALYCFTKSSAAPEPSARSDKKRNCEGGVFQGTVFTRINIKKSELNKNQLANFVLYRFGGMAPFGHAFTF